MPDVNLAPRQYTVPESELFAELGSCANGLTSEQAGEVLRKTGPNTVAAGGRHSV